MTNAVGESVLGGLGSIELKAGLNPAMMGDVRCHLNAEKFDEADTREVDAYRRTRESRSGDDGYELFNDLVHKANFVSTFREVIPCIGVENGQRILEIGAGQGWASVIVKRLYPCSHVVAADIAPDALQFARHYESMLSAELDEKWAFDVREMPFADAQFDRIFCFAAFHHFSHPCGTFTDAVSEILRVLRPEGKAIFLYEPSSPRWFYHRAHRRVNKRLEVDGVMEDVVLPARLRRDAETLGAQLDVEYYPLPRFRDGVTQTLYYAILSRAHWLCRYTVCTANMVLRRR